MKRRSFLQRIGSILAVLGVTEAEWLTLGNRYYQALAQPNPRKLALLVGINQYQKSSPLNGCLTDVELQKELLIHRFGFQSSDILTLTEEQASREFIEAAFLDHLVNQAKSGDVVVFHFSGYGRRISLTDSPDALQNALVTANGHQDSRDEKLVNDLLEETLLLLLRSLPTEYVTAVLDTSYYAPNIPQLAGTRIRTLPALTQVQLATAELDFLKQLKTKTALSNGVILSATSESGQLAREALLSGFSAGLFTYALTQYLWETTPATTIQVSLSDVSSTISKLGSKQQPGLSNNKKSLTVENLLLDHNIVAGQGAIAAIEEDGKIAQLWLAGIPAQVLEYYGVNSRFSISTGEQLILRSRSGLTAKAQIPQVEGASPFKVGQILQEAVRVLPKNINLIIGLDTGLERIERVDATSAFAGIPHISTVVAGEQPADYIFGKLLQTPSRYGLFTLGGELIGNTSGEVGEAVKLAVLRLASKLPNLLAAKLWRLTENAGSSRLKVNATLEIIHTISSRVIMQRETSRTLSSKKSFNTPVVPIGSRMQYRVQNQSDRPIYLMLLGLRNNRTAIAFYPWQITEEPHTPETKPLLKQVIIAPGETVTLPKTAVTSGWVIPAPNECEHQLILSTAPFSETLEVLETAKYPGDQQPIGVLVNPLEIAEALLKDLHNASAVKAEINTPADSYILDVNNWASLSFSFQVA